MHGAIPPLSQYVFMEWCLVKHKDKFTFTLTVNNINMTIVRTFEVGEILVTVAIGP